MLEADCFYHIYNHANGSEKIFKSNYEYEFFLQQYTLFIAPIADTFCYCLMPNHFHFLIRIKPHEELIGFFEGLSRLRAAAKRRQQAGLTDFPKSKTLENQSLPAAAPLNLEKLLSKQFSNFFSSYTQSRNKLTGRMGSMFMKNFKRKRVNDLSYLLTLVQYIHRNPAEANLCKGHDAWKYSSFKQICTGTTPWISSSEVVSWFGDLENFIFIHTRT